MKLKARVDSILYATNLDFSVTGFHCFDLIDLDLTSNLDFPLPSNLRLGHLVERVVSHLINRSDNYNILHENLQLIEAGRTLGELDFIIENKNAKEVIHLELAYKFYLFDPNISSDPLYNWIGPNRNDSLVQKLDKLKSKQFSLLYHESAKSELKHIDIDNVSQALCFLASLFIPYEYKGTINVNLQKAIKGYYIDLDTFLTLNESATALYYIPSKIEWGIDPSENENWASFEIVKKQIVDSINEKRSPLVWQKKNNYYSSFFIVWW